MTRIFYIIFLFILFGCVDDPHLVNCHCKKEECHTNLQPGFNPLTEITELKLQTWCMCVYKECEFPPTPKVEKE